MCNESSSRDTLLECFRKRRAREDSLFNTRTNLVLVANGLAAIAATSAPPVEGTSPVPFVVVAILIFNLLWTLYAPDPATYIRFLGKCLESTPDELIREDVMAACTWRRIKLPFKLPWDIAEIGGFRIGPTGLMARVIPPLLLGTWLAGVVGEFIWKLPGIGGSGRIAFWLGLFIGGFLAAVAAWFARPPKRDLCNSCYRLFEPGSEHECRS